MTIMLQNITQAFMLLLTVFFMILREKRVILQRTLQCSFSL